SHRITNKIMHRRLLPETYLRFRRMNVNVNFRRRQLKKKQHHWKQRRRKNISVRLRQRMLNEAVTDQASIDENINRIPIQFLNLGFGHEPVDPQLSKTRDSFFLI